MSGRMADLIAEVASAPDPEHLTATTVRAVATLPGVVRAAVILCHDDDVSCAIHPASFTATPHAARSLLETGLYATAFQRGMRLHVDTRNEYSAAAAGMIPPGPTVIQPLCDETGDPAGIVAVHRADGPGFEQHEIGQITTVATAAERAYQTWRRIQRYHRQLRYFGAITEVSHALVKATDLRKILMLAVDMVMLLSPAERCWLFVADREGVPPRLVAARGLPPEMLSRLEPGLGYGPGTLHQFQIRTEGGSAGVLELMVPGDLQPWERNALQSLGNLAVVSLQQARLQQEQRQVLEESILALVAALEARDPYTQGHSARVAAYAVWLGEAAGLGPQEVNRLRLGGYLHDIGKIGIPEGILLKPGRVTDEEYAAIKQHPVIGYQIVRHVAGLSPLLSLVRHHHERLDGSGYPDGLSGDEIPTLVRILAIADVFEALVSDRPYRRAMSVDEAIKVLAAGAGSLFDAALVEIFTRTLRDKIGCGEFPPPVTTLLSQSH